MLLHHAATHTVLLPQLSSFDSDLKGTRRKTKLMKQTHCMLAVVLTFGAVVVMTLLASCVYGTDATVKEAVLTDSLLRTVADCIHELPQQAPVGRAACILLCNMLAGCDANVSKASVIVVDGVTARVCADETSNADD